MENTVRKTFSGGGVVMNPQGEVLVTHQHGTSWSLPKGHVEGSEDAVAAARREIFEETGVRELELVRELGSYQRHGINQVGDEDTSELKTIKMYLFRTTQTSLEPVDPENTEARWMPKEKVEQLLTHPKDKAFFSSVINTL